MSLSVREILQLPRLQALRLRAGGAGVQRSVRWPYLAQDPSIAEWVRGGELVFVTGINTPHDEGDLLRRVREAHASDCAGLVILTGPLYIQRIPDRVLAEADRLGLPLIEQPYALPLVEVTEAIGSALVQAQMLGQSRQQLVKHLLEGDIADATVLEQRAQALGLEFGGMHRVLVLQATGSAALKDSLGAEQAERRLQTLRASVSTVLERCLETLGASLPVLSQGEQWIALLPIDTASLTGVGRMRTTLETLIANLTAEAAPLRLYGGLGAPCPHPGELPRGLGEARHALAVALALPERPGLCCFEELGVIELLTAIRDRSLLERFVTNTLGALMQHDKAHNSALIETLEAWIQSNGNLVAAASSLGVHRNTLNHRMHQIETLGGLDLAQAQQRLNIAIALMIRRLSPHSPAKNTRNSA